MYNQLQNVIKHAYQTAPYYKKLFDVEYPHVKLLFLSIYSKKELYMFQGAYVRKEQGEHIYVYVETHCRDFDMKAVLAYCQMNLEDYKVPSRIIIVDKLNRTLNGKIVRDSKERRLCENDT